MKLSTPYALSLVFVALGCTNPNTISMGGQNGSASSGSPPPTPTPTPISTPTPTPVSGVHNPTSYNAITNTNVYNSAAPALGAAGSVTVDPDFGTNVLRVTQSGSCGAVAGGYFAANEGAGWVRTINSNDTAVLFGGPGGSFYVQPVTLSSSSMALNGNCVEVVGGTAPLTGTGVIFAATNPDLVYGLDVDGRHFDSFNWTNSTKTQLVDLSKIPGFTYSSLYLAYCDANDAWCATSSNTQDIGHQAAFYNLKTGHTAVVNFTNATVQFDSNAPMAMDNATASLLAGCGMHETIPSLDGMWWDFTLNGCSSGNLPHGFDSLYWQVGTNHVTYITDLDEVGGHEAMGNGVYTNAPGASVGCSGPYQAFSVALWNLANLGGNPGNWVGVTNCNEPLWDANIYTQHFSWLNDYNDSYSNSYPILSLGTTQNTNTGKTYEWELEMIDMSSANAKRKANGPFDQWASSSPTVWRIAHTYNDPVNTQCLSQGYQSPNISGDGKYALFTSDWLGQTGAGTCVNNRRTDVFVVELP